MRADRPAVEPRRETFVSLSLPASHLALALGATHRLLAVDALSARIPALADLPVVDLEGASLLAPDLVLLPGPPDERDPTLQSLRDAGVELVEFAPHDLEDVFALLRDVGERLAGPTRARAFENALARPLAAIGGESFGQARPRVLAVVGLDPLLVAGGHSFETDLIEIAGGSSITHGGDEPRLLLEEAELSALAPDLVLVLHPEPPAPRERLDALERLGTGARVEFLAVDAQWFWLRDPAAAARRLRAVIGPLARELDRRARGAPLADRKAS